MHSRAFERHVGCESKSASAVAWRPGLPTVQCTPNIVGMHWRGKAGIVKGHDVFHRTIFQQMEIGVTDISIGAITPDVAAAVIALKAGAYTTPDGKQQNATLDRLSLILVNRNGEWKIAHGHNTVVDPAAVPFDPVNSGWNGEARR